MLQAASSPQKAIQPQSSPPPASWRTNERSSFTNPESLNKMSEEEDLVDSLLGLEDKFYTEGFELGVSDGKRAGLIEGRLFGLEKGFEKFLAMGRMHGRATVWAGRLPNVVDPMKEEAIAKRTEEAAKHPGSKLLTTRSQDDHSTVAQGPQVGVKTLENPRLRIHVRTLYALTEPESLSTVNNEDSVADFDDRLKRAEGKIKVIEKITGEATHDDHEVEGNENLKAKGDHGIEDISSLHARH